MSTRGNVARLAGGVLAALVATVVVVSAIGRIAGFSEVRATLEDATPSWLVLCAVGQVAVFVGYAGALRRTVASGGGGASIGVGASLRLALAGFAATQVFAFGGLGGLALLYWALRRFGRDRRQAIVELVGLNTTIYLVFGLVAWTGAAFASAAPAPASMTVPWLVGIPTLVLAARWFTAPSRVGRWTSPDHGGVRGLLGIGVAAAAWTRARTTDERRLFAWALLYWVGDVLSLAAALRAFDADPAISALVVAYATGYLVQALPIPLIATAGVDAATVATLHAIGVPVDAALLGVLAHRLFAFWLPVVPGSVLALTLPGLAPPEDGPQRSGVSDTAESS